jgi:alpha-ribazole phosphatase
VFKLKEKNNKRKSERYKKLTDIYLIRHGQTDSNNRGTYQGWTDNLLNDVGERQAEKTAERIIEYGIEKIYSSPLKRSAKTSEIIGNKLGIKVDFVDGLKELNFGIFDDLTYKEIIEKYPDESKVWAEDWINYEIEKGESSKQAYDRINNAIDVIIRENEDKKIAIVTHLGAIRMILAKQIIGSIEGNWRFDAANCSITRLMINDKYAVLKCLNT